jgi:hypothetical protein
MPTPVSTPKSKPTPKARKPKKEEAPAETRPVLYPDVEVQLYRGDKAMTAAEMKEILGWQEESEEVKFGSDFLLTDYNGRKIRCLHNTKNRPLALSWAQTIGQDILNRHWKLNGESLIRGKYGQVLSGQHRGIGLILACQRWASEKEGAHWKKIWPTEPTIELVLVSGIEETGDVTRTLDNVKPRTLADVLFCDPAYFGQVMASDRAALCRIMDYGIRLCWHRTGADTNAFAPRRTHSEALDWLDRHPRIKDAVRHVFEEDSKGGIRRYISPGYASGLLYLMAASDTDPAAYQGAESPSEALLDLGKFDAACDFWTLLAQTSEDLQPVRNALGNLNHEDGTKGGSLAEYTGIVVKAWNEFASSSKVKEEFLTLKYETDRDGERHLVECPVVGGIDLGDPQKEEQQTPAAPEPTEEEVEEAKEKATNGKKASAPEPQERTEEAARVDALMDLRKKYPGRILLFYVSAKPINKFRPYYSAWGGDVKLLNNLEPFPAGAMGKRGGMPFVNIEPNELDGYLAKLQEGGHKVAIVDSDTMEVKEVGADPNPPKSRPKPGGKK